MPTFDASYVGKIGYDFSEWGGPSGTVPEPSDNQIEELMNTVQDIMKSSGMEDMQNADADDPEQLTSALSNADEQFFTKMQEDLIDAFGDLCGGSPSKQVLRDLPYRVRNAFFGYLMGEVTSPEGETGDTKKSLAVKRNV